MLITARELQDQLAKHKNDVVVVDCRFQLGNKEAGREQYLHGHVPGAFYLDLEQDLSAPVDLHGGRHPLPDEQTLVEKLGGIGIGAEQAVVVYDGGEGMVTRAWWLIRYLGHSRVHVLDGGLQAWQAAGYAVDNEISVATPREFPYQPHREWVVSTDEVEGIVARHLRVVAAAATAGALNPTVASPREGQLLVDARAPERYRGDIEPLDPKAGHIPGAKNAHWMDGLSLDGRWLDRETLRQRFAFASSAEQIIAYCGSGVTACANIFALQLAGYPHVKLYAGSWSDWCSYDEHPVATGDE